MKGEIFMQAGRVAFSSPPLGTADATPFEVLKEWPASSRFPAWTDIDVGGTLVRANPDLLAGFPRVDCLLFAHLQADRLAKLAPPNRALMTFPPRPHPSATEYLFWVEVIGGKRYVMIDTRTRVQRHAPK